MSFHVGQRVIHKDNEIGIVENEHGDNDELTTDVRWLTPNNEPSCCVSLCLTENLTPVPDSVVPMPKSRAWWEKSRQFCAALRALVKEELCEGK